MLNQEYYYKTIIFLLTFLTSLHPQVTDDEEEEVEGEEPKVMDVDEEEAKDKEKKTKKVKQVSKSWSHLNEQKPIWMRYVRTCVSWMRGTGCRCVGVSGWH